MRNLSLRSVVSAYPLPFAVIDENYTVIAVNDSFRRKYQVPGSRLLGGLCYELSHRYHRPCHELGEECPHRRVYETGLPSSCVHLHVDASGRRYRVRISAHLLESDDGRRLIGESLDEITLLEGPLAENSGLPMVGSSPAFMETVAQLRLAARSEFPALLLGETGTGKELAARFVHNHSARATGPYFTLDCTTIPESLFESEVFGHERGAFSGSVGEKKGLFELADGGTLFLDEVGELPAGAQAKLLRALESGEYRRVGGRVVRRADVRIICATNRHLTELVKQRGFREDLFYRIACLTVRLPALRERRTDIPELAHAFVAELPSVHGRAFHILDDALAELTTHEFPGNIRQLRQLIHAAAAHSPDGYIDRECIAHVLRRASGGCAETSSISESSAMLEPATLSERERRYIGDLLEAHDGNRRKVAEQLGISTRTLYRKLIRYRFR